MKKYGFLITTILLTAFLSACFKPDIAPVANNLEPDPIKSEEGEGEQNVSMENPWSDTTMENIENKLGITVILPEGADNVSARTLSAQDLYEIIFDYYGMKYNYRLKRTDSLEDISGLYYDWTVSLEEKLRGHDAVSYRSISDNETVDLVIWYDENDLVSHSLSVSAQDLDGYDLSAVAMMMMPIAGGEGNYGAMYAPVLDENRDYILNGFDENKDYSYVSSGVIERVNYGETDELLDSIGYTIKDITGDGVPELLIGENDTIYSEDGESHIYSVYTISNGTPVCVLEGWARNSYFYLGGCDFSYLGSGGAMYTFFGEGSLTFDGTEFYWKDYYFSSNIDGGDEMFFFRNTSGSFDVDNSEQLDIEASEFWDMLDDYKYELITWTPFKD